MDKFDLPWITAAYMLSLSYRRVVRNQKIQEGGNNVIV